MIKADKCQTISVTKYKDMKEYRLQAGLSQQKLAIKLGVRQATVSDWENGIYFPVPENIQKMAQIFDVPPEKLEGDIRVWFAVRQLKKLKIPKEDLLCMMS